ncbi:MAG: four helix bundle protein [Calditrichaceae bacterium]
MEYEVDIKDGEFIVQEAGRNYVVDLNQRLLSFSVEIIRFLMSLPYKKEFEVLRLQLSKSATSIGANYEESQASTYKEFNQKVRIALRESNETNYWLKIVRELGVGDLKKLEKLMIESREISLILGAIASKVDKKLKENKNIR